MAQTAYSRCDRIIALPVSVRATEYCRCVLPAGHDRGHCGHIPDVAEVAAVTLTDGPMLEGRRVFVTCVWEA